MAICSQYYENHNIWFGLFKQTYCALAFPTSALKSCSNMGSKYKKRKKLTEESKDGMEKIKMTRLKQSENAGSFHLVLWILSLFYLPLLSSFSLPHTTLSSPFLFPDAGQTKHFGETQLFYRWDQRQIVCACAFLPFCARYIVHLWGQFSHFPIEGLF